MFLVGIAGGSGSGKTTFANKVLQRVKHPGVALLHQDSYYLPSPPAHLRVHGEPNFDHPDAFDWPLLKDQLSRLKAGETVGVPTYDFQTSRRQSQTVQVGPCKAILLEGIFALWDEEIRNLFDVKIFLNVDSDIRFIRRLHRDVRERGRTLDGIIRQYYDTVRPMYQKHLEPTRQYADLVVGDETDVASEVLGARVAELCR
jgi:uridine kinase